MSIESVKNLKKKIMKFNAISFLLIGVLILSGCANAVKVDKKVVEVLPDAIAQKIINNKLGTVWANAPYIMKSGVCSIIPTQIPISIKDINKINYNPTLGNLYVQTEETVSTFMYTCFHSKSFSLNENDAHEVTVALKALGACTGPYASCR
jgi:hypothetical protein